MPFALPLSRIAIPWGPASRTAWRREHLGSLRTRSQVGSRPRVATVPCSSTSWEAPVGCTTSNLTFGLSLSRESHADSSRNLNVERPPRGPSTCPLGSVYDRRAPMITSDPARRAARLEEIRQILAAQASPEDRDLLLAFAPAVLGEMPDRLALGLPPEALAARVREHFRFVVREMPPDHQLYKELPGIHVVARNPTEQEAASEGVAE